jgi:hypothetical protein
MTREGLSSLHSPPPEGRCEKIVELVVGSARRSVPRCQGALNSNGFATLQGTELRPFPTERSNFSHLQGCRGGSSAPLSRAGESKKESLAPLAPTRERGWR